MKTFKTLFATIAVLLCCNSVRALNFKVNGIYYSSTSESEVSVTYKNKYNHDNYYESTIVIPETVTYKGKTYSVTSIGDDAFVYCSWLRNVTIPNSVTEIGARAFRECTSLTDIIIPNSVTEIGACAFSYCTSLTNITIPNSVTSIKKDAFESTAWYENQSDGLVYSGKLAYRYKGVMPNNTSIELAEGTLGFAEYAFSGCTSLTNITIPNSVTSIAEYAFNGCTSLTDIIIPNSVTEIGLCAFSGCTSLTNITIPNSVTSIESHAFNDCKINTMIIGTNTQSIGYHYSGPIKTIWLTNTPPQGHGYLSGKINYAANDQYTFKVRVYPYLSSMFEVDGVKYVPVSPSERTCDAIDCTYEKTQENIAINSTVSFKGIVMTVKEILPYAFYQNEYIKDLSANNNGNIGDCAFQNCTNLQNIKLKEGITSLGSSAFSGCSLLNRIDIPNSVNELGEAVLYGCTALETVKVGNSIQAIPPYVFHSCGALSEIVIPQSVTNIGNYAFQGCTALTNVIIEDRDSTLSLGCNGSNPMFSDCPLDSVYIGGDISYNTSKSYGYSPFYRNTSLRTVVITDKEDEIYDNEFYGCTGLKNVTIGNGVKKIGNWAFSGCSNLDYFAFGKNVESIGEEAFSDCVNVTQLISSAATPPTCGTQALDDINKWSCTLKVPMESLTAYQQADQWKDFFFMEGVETSINSIKPNNGKSDAYNTDGRLIQRNADIKSLKKGLYIINGKKVMVR